MTEGCRMTVGRAVLGKYDTKEMRKRTGMDAQDGPYDSDEDPYAEPVELRPGKILEAVPAHPRLDGKQSSRPYFDNVVTKAGVELFGVQFVTPESLEAAQNDDSNRANLLLASFPMQLLLRVQDAPGQKRLFLDCLEPMPVLEAEDTMPLVNEVKRGRKVLALSSWQPFDDRQQGEASREASRDAANKELEADADKRHAWTDDVKAKEGLEFLASVGRFASGRSFRYCLDLADVTAARLHVPGPVGAEGAWGADERLKDACLVLQVTPLCLLSAQSPRRPFAVRAICCSFDESVYQACEDWTPHGAASRAHQIIIYGSLYEMSELSSLLCRVEPRLVPLFDAYAVVPSEKNGGGEDKMEKEKEKEKEEGKVRAAAAAAAAAASPETASFPHQLEPTPASAPQGSAAVPLAALLEAGRSLLKTTKLHFPPVPILTPLGPHSEMNELELVEIAMYLDTTSLARLALCSTLLRGVLSRCTPISEGEVRKIKKATAKRKVTKALLTLDITDPDNHDYREFGEDVNHCLLAGILRGHVPAASPLDLEAVLLEAPCWFCIFNGVPSPPRLTCTLAGALYQPMRGSRWGLERGGVKCPVCDESNYITHLCSGEPGFSSGRNHNHCEACDNYGTCVGNCEYYHCEDCGNHFFGGGNCQCDTRGRYSGVTIVAPTARVPVDELGTHWDGRDAGQIEALDTRVLAALAELDLEDPSYRSMDSRGRLRLLTRLAKEAEAVQGGEHQHVDGDDDGDIDNEEEEEEWETEEENEEEEEEEEEEDGDDSENRL